MGELKAHRFWDFDEISRTDAIVGSLYYLKSEADKVITELEDKSRHYTIMASIIESAKRDILRNSHEIRHNKYKRCLAMAKRCEDKIDNPVQYNEHDEWLIITEYWERWHNRWLELAEKFKEAK